MTLEQKERRKAVLRYAVSVPEWNLALKHFQKGSMIAIEGSLQTRQYQDQQGSNRTVVEIVANNVSFCSGKAAEKPATASY
jgi:single-stranded DNA-binding protein